MTDRELFQETFDQLHASQDTLSEVMTMIQQEKNAAQKPHKTAKTVKTIALVAAAAAVLMTTAFASGLVDYLEALLTPADTPSDIAQATLVEADISTEKPDMLDSAGNPIEMPDMERVSTDEDTVQTLTEGYLYDMDATLTLDNDLTITFDSFIMDEQGMGILTYTVSNPNGVSWSDAGYGDIYSISGMYDPQLWVDGTDNCDSAMYLLEGDNTDTEIHIAQYFGMGQTYQPGQTLLFTVPETENGTLRITPEACIPATEMTDGQGHDLTLSPLGLRIGWHDAKELGPDEIILHYADGTDYVVEGDGIFNRSLGYWEATDHYDTTGEYTYEYICEMFNRLVDVDTVESVTVTGHTYEQADDGTYEPVYETYTFTR